MELNMNVSISTESLKKTNNILRWVVTLTGALAGISAGITGQILFPLFIAAYLAFDLVGMRLEKRRDELMEEMSK